MSLRDPGKSEGPALGRPGLLPAKRVELLQLLDLAGFLVLDGFLVGLDGAFFAEDVLVFRTGLDGAFGLLTLVAVAAAAVLSSRAIFR